jgi:TatA/E family protein of Tat protein translocase
MVAMFGLGATELIFIFILALLIFGPKKLPQIGRTIGKGMAEFRRASTELQRAVNTEIEDPPAPRSPAPRMESRLETRVEAPGQTTAQAALEEGTKPSQFQ